MGFWMKENSMNSAPWLAMGASNLSLLVELYSRLLAEKLAPIEVMATGNQRAEFCLSEVKRKGAAAAAGAALRLCVLLLLQLRCVTAAGVPGHSEVTGEQASYAARLQAVLGVKSSPGEPPVAPRRSAPQFMLDLFNAVSVRDKTPKTQTEVLFGNTVRSLEDKGPSREGFHLFNMSSIGKDEKMIKVEFRWFRKKARIIQGMSRLSHFYKVNVYEVLDSGDKPQRGNLITSRLMSLYSHGWEVFNVTQIVSKWIQGSQNNGIMMVVVHPTGFWRKSFDGGVKDGKAYLVLVSDDGRSGASGLSLPGKTHRSDPDCCISLTRSSAPTPQEATFTFIFSSPRHPPTPCQRVPLYVDFDEIGWSGWIISPRGYHANHCKGSCPFPLGGGLSATNHATVLSIVHTLRLSSSVVGAPCCVPDRLESISLLYFDDEENVVLKQYDEMVAMSCGCH
ncbi:bone morphogenetic protein 2 [Gouania willdenowi]|uniref:bone morphogenetic protein 2 n=1 Tax=Gouania willdenowi TaxID=441366 RepID=UPI0010546738|nr:bone morphogenetic protein 2-like [Gouania willdenowi]